MSNLKTEITENNKKTYKVLLSWDKIKDNSKIRILLNNDVRYNTKANKFNIVLDKTKDNVIKVEEYIDTEILNSKEITLLQAPTNLIINTNCKRCVAGYDIRNVLYYFDLEWGDMVGVDKYNLVISDNNKTKTYETTMARLRNISERDFTMCDVKLSAVKDGVEGPSNKFKLWGGTFTEDTNICFDPKINRDVLPEIVEVEKVDEGIVYEIKDSNVRFNDNNTLYRVLAEYDVRSPLTDSIIFRINQSQKPLRFLVGFNPRQGFPSYFNIKNLKNIKVYAGKISTNDVIYTSKLSKIIEPKITLPDITNIKIGVEGKCFSVPTTNNIATTLITWDHSIKDATYEVKVITEFMETTIKTTTQSVIVPSYIAALFKFQVKTIIGDIQSEFSRVYDVAQLCNITEVKRPIITLDLNNQERRCVKYNITNTDSNNYILNLYSSGAFVRQTIIIGNSVIFGYNSECGQSFINPTGITDFSVVAYKSNQDFNVTLTSTMSRYQNIQNAVSSFITPTIGGINIWWFIGIGVIVLLIIIIIIYFMFRKKETIKKVIV